LWVTDRQEALERIALGVTLTLTATKDCGRKKALWVDGDPYKPYGYRPNWGLPGMAGTEQAGAMVLSLGHVPFAPGETDRAVIVPFMPGALPLWQEIRPGDQLRASEGAHVVGTAIVEWVARRDQRVTEDQQTRFTAWATGQEGTP
jgi:hypothetical protein